MNPLSPMPLLARITPRLLLIPLSAIAAFDAESAEVLANIKGLL
jgi:hypothetical protein